MEASPDRPFYVLVVNHLIDSVIAAANQLQHDNRYKNLRLLLVTDEPKKYENYKKEAILAAIIPCDYTAEGVTNALESYLPDIRAVVCRRDAQIAQLRGLMPFLPPDVLVSSPESLEAATHKKFMRMAFTQHFPEITPGFLRVTNASEAQIQKIETRLDYPVIVKPTSLASSLFVQSCHTRAELQATLHKVFELIDEASKKVNQTPSQVIVEEYLEGDFYSVDAYVMRSGEIYCCPPVAYVPAKHIGVDDFFLYKRFTPSGLNEAQVRAAEVVTRKAMIALGLTHSSAHAELVRTKSGWRVIEVGPRIGRFRHTMYQQAYGIDHSLNDLRIHVGLPPVIPTKLQKYCAAYSFYPYEEGRLHSIKHWNELLQTPELVWQKEKSRPGDIALFAKHGGHALAEAIIATSSKKKYLELIGWIEAHVIADIDNS